MLYALVPGDEPDDDHIPADFKLLEALYERCVRGRDKPDVVLRRPVWSKEKRTVGRTEASEGLPATLGRLRPA
jgi:hypothetical protein